MYESVRSKQKPVLTHDSAVSRCTGIFSAGAAKNVEQENDSHAFEHLSQCTFGGRQEGKLAMGAQEKSLASQSWEESRLGTLDSADEPSISRVPMAARENGNGNGSQQPENGNGSHQPDHLSSRATARRDEERHRHEAKLSTASLEQDSVDEMWQAGGEVAAHDAPAAAPKKAI